MLGSALGNVVGTLYFLLYQFAGVLIAFTVLRGKTDGLKFCLAVLWEVF